MPNDECVMHTENVKNEDIIIAEMNLKADAGVAMTAAAPVAVSAHAAAVVDDNTLAVALPFEHNKHAASNSMHSLQLDISVHVLT